MNGLKDAEKDESFGGAGDITEYKMSPLKKQQNSVKPDLIFEL